MLERRLPPRFAALAFATLCIVSFACGDDVEGPPCQDATDCDEVDCGGGVVTRVCDYGHCVSDPDEVCHNPSAASGTVGAGGIMGAGGDSGVGGFI